MIAIARSIRDQAASGLGPSAPRVFAVALGAGLIAVAAAQSDGLGAVVVSTLAEAYLAVTTFVALTLAAFLAVERAFGVDVIEAIRRRPRLETMGAALLGALPGCGGAIIVATQYAKGRMSFGALLASLTATMGDAAFLLIAREPLTGLLIFVLGFAVGSATGFVVDKIHGRSFLRPSAVRAPDAVVPNAAEGLGLDRLWLALIVPGAVFGVAEAFQIDLAGAIGLGAALEPAAATAAMLAVAMWAVRGKPEADGAAPARRLIDDTNFVTAWVVAAFLVYEVGAHAFGLDVGAAFASAGALVPLVAVLIGLLPGCGPQIVVTALYLGGAVPLSAQIGNALSNDGDALFPAMALAPKAATVATLYSALPAVLVAYGAWAMGY